jgi:hypothetical protein
MLTLRETDRRDHLPPLPQISSPLQNLGPLLSYEPLSECASPLGCGGSTPPKGVRTRKGGRARSNCPSDLRHKTVLRTPPSFGAGCVRRKGIPQRGEHSAGPSSLGRTQSGPRPHRPNPDDHRMLHRHGLPRPAIPRQACPSPSRVAPSNTTDDYDDSKSRRGHSPQHTECICHKTWDVVNEYIDDVYLYILVLTICTACALLMIQIEIERNPLNI